VAVAGILVIFCDFFCEFFLSIVNFVESSGAGGAVGGSGWVAEIGSLDRLRAGLSNGVKFSSFGQKLSDFYSKY
jgi:hypothetical protein